MDRINADKLKKGEYWHGRHKGISFKIQRWERPDVDTRLLKDVVWNYYIFLNLSKINPVDAKKLWLRGKAYKFSIGRRVYGYYDCAPLRDIELQGGITWYSKQYTLNDEKMIEIGCDYDHIWNDDHDYQLSDIAYDVSKSIDSVLERFPELVSEPPHPTNLTDTVGTDA